MKKLNDHHPFTENPYFNADLVYRNGGVVTIAVSKMDEVLKLNALELKAFLLILMHFHRQRRYEWANKLGVRYYHSFLLEYYDITKAKAREVTISLIEKEFIARTKERNLFFINPEYMVDLFDTNESPSYTRVANAANDETIRFTRNHATDKLRPTKIQDILP